MLMKLMARNFGLNPHQFIQRAAEFKPIAAFDDYRSPDAYKDGGFPLNDQEAIDKLRKAFKSLLS